MTHARQLLILWHSRTGASQQLAQAAWEGACQAIALLQAHSSLAVSLLPCDQVSTHDFLQADAYLFCAPENLGSLSGAMKECLDRLYYPALEQINGRPYSVIISAGSDGQGALRQTERICTGWRLHLAYPGIIANFNAQTATQIMAPKNLTEQQKQQAWELGANLCALLH